MEVNDILIQLGISSEPVDDDGRITITQINLRNCLLKGRGPNTGTM